MMPAEIETMATKPFETKIFIALAMATAYFCILNSVQSDDHEEWERKSLKELPRSILSQIPRAMGMPDRIEKGKYAKEIEGYKLTWKHSQAEQWIVFSERGEVLVKFWKKRTNKPSPAFSRKKSKAGNALSDPLPVNVSYEKHVKPWIKSNCLKCHNDRKSKGGVDLSSYDKTVNETVQKTNPDSSLLIDVLLGRDADLMPPNRARPKSEIELIKRWITRGAPEK